MVHAITASSRSHQRRDSDRNQRHKSIVSESSAPTRHSVKGALRTATHGAIAIVPGLHVKAWTPDDDADWWFAGTAVPLLAATLGPAANVLSIAALVTPWRVCLVDAVDPATCPWDGQPSSLIAELDSHAYSDPHWAYNLNAASLVLGFVGNLFLLFNFTGFVRYKLALPVTIIMWYLATGILMAITVSLHIYRPPVMPQQMYSQGFWYGVLAASLYLIAAMLLMLNMVGFFLGHFPEQFNLTDSQRTLILQTMMFFIWLAAGGGIFSKVESVYGDQTQDWSYVNGLYFSDVTILTVGFGDLVCTSDLGRGLVFPYSVGGIIMLGLVISSISKFASELGADKVVKKHQERSRARTLERVVTNVEEQRSRLGFRRRASSTTPQSISAPFNPVNRALDTQIAPAPADPSLQSPTKSFASGSTLIRFVAQTTKTLTSRKPRKHKSRLLLLREERDRFNTMRHLEMSTQRYKRWMSFFLATVCFAMLWLLGAVVFYYAEATTQKLTYFEALYFCYVSLLTVGYGDFAPKSNVGRPFFVLWSLTAVPTMTILVSSMGNTVVQGFKTGTERVAEFTVLPRMGLLRDALERWPFYKRSVDTYRRNREARKVNERLRMGFPVGMEQNSSTSGDNSKNQDRGKVIDLETLAKEAADGEHPLSELQLARRLATSIQRVAIDLRVHPPIRYCYEEWVEFTQLIRFTNYSGRGRDTHLRHNHHHNPNRSADSSAEQLEADVEELIEWDWIGENSPMMAKQSEAEFVLDRLCESMGRYLRQAAVREEYRAKDTGVGTVETMGAHIPADEDGETSLDDVREEVDEEGDGKAVEDLKTSVPVPGYAEGDGVAISPCTTADGSGVTAVELSQRLDDY